MKTSTILHKLGIGTVQFGLDYGISNRNGITKIDEVKKILDLARNLGINRLDTAYGYGKSEEVLGKLGVSDFKVVSKFMPESSDTRIQDQVNTSLKRLKVDRLYGLLYHRPMEAISNPHTWESLLRLKKSGIVEKIGFSFNTPNEAEKVLEGGFMPDLIQVPFNYFDRRFSSTMHHLKKNGCEIHSRSSFLQGLFFVPAEELPEFFEEIKPTLIKLQVKGEFLPCLLLKHCLEQDFIDTVIIGVNNLDQLKENIRWIETRDTLPEFNQQIRSEILTPSEWPKTR